jgi:hypothetical protein
LPAFLNVLPEPIHDLLDVDLANISHRTIPRIIATRAKVWSMPAQHQSRQYAKDCKLDWRFCFKGLGPC